jgi:RNA-directed DNA polymerase
MLRAAGWAGKGYSFGIKDRLEFYLENTSRIEFVGDAELNRKERGEGKPETFDFLRSTHRSWKNRNGSCVAWISSDRDQQELCATLRTWMAMGR